MILSLFKKIRKKKWIFRNILSSIYFNFHYLPFKQAIHLPILFYKPTFAKLKGKVIIDCDSVKMGMIQLGLMQCVLFPNNGFVFENNGGTIVFKGKTIIGNGSAISIGSKGYLEIGQNFRASTQFRCTAYHKIVIGERCRFGWDCIIMDTDFHKLTKVSGGYSKGYGAIKIGSNNWFGTRCFVLKKTETSDYCVVSGGTRISGKFIFEKPSIIGSTSKVELLKEGYWRNVDDETIDYE